MLKTFLSLVMLLAPAPRLAAQTATPQQPTAIGAAGDASQAAAAAALQGVASVAQQRATLLADVRALAEESKELLKPLDAAAARAEVAAAAWTLDREWSKGLLREALALTFPEEAYRPKLREHEVGAPLRPPTPEDQARGMVRRRVLKIAAADPAFARELAGVSARELGSVQEVEQYTMLAGDAAREGRLDEAGDLIERAIQAEPTLINIAGAIDEVAVRDRAAADRLMLRYVEALRSLPLSVFTERNHTGLRLPFSFISMLVPGSGMSQPDDFKPPSREVVRAYIDFVMDTMNRAEQVHGDITQMHTMLALLWPLVAEQAPELTAQFNALELASRRPGATFPPLRTFAEMKKSGDKRYEERIKTAKETKDSLDLEMAVNSAMSRNDFEEVRKLLDMLKDEHLKSQLTEMADEKEAVYLTNKGDTAGASRLARQLTRPDSILRAYPPLIRRLAKNKDAASAQFLAYEAVQHLKTSAEKEATNDSYIPSLLASVASSIRVFKQSRALVAMSELALAVESVDAGTALDVLDAMVDCASKARITSEQGSPNFNAEAFARLAAADDARVRATASRLEDRLQRIVALAAVYCGEAVRLNEDAERLNRKNDGARPTPTPVR